MGKFPLNSELLNPKLNFKELLNVLGFCNDTYKVPKVS